MAFLFSSSSSSFFSLILTWEFFPLIFFLLPPFHWEWKGGRRGEERQKYWYEREWLIGCPSHSTRWRLGLEPANRVHALDQELNMRTLKAWTNALTTERNQPGCISLLKFFIISSIFWPYSSQLFLKPFSDNIYISISCCCCQISLWSHHLFLLQLLQVTFYWTPGPVSQNANIFILLRYPSRLTFLKGQLRKSWIQWGTDFNGLWKAVMVGPSRFVLFLLPEHSPPGASVHHWVVSRPHPIGLFQAPMLIFLALLDKQHFCLGVSCSYWFAGISDSYNLETAGRWMSKSLGAGLPTCAILFSWARSHLLPTPWWCSWFLHSFACTDYRNMLAALVADHWGDDVVIKMLPLSGGRFPPR